MDTVQTGNGNSASSTVHAERQIEPFEGTKVLLPFNPPEAVKHWLRQEDWDVLTKAWAEAESQSVDWAAADFADIEQEYLEQEELSRVSQVRRRATRKRQEWDEKWSLLGNDHGLPPTRRRYFDGVAKEISSFKEATRPGLRNSPDQLGSDEAHLPGQKPWDRTHTSMASTDNVALHPFLRHYFDSRGLEASYRMRPHVDHETLRKLPKRTSGRPPTAEKLARWSSEPSLPSLAQKSVQEDDEAATITWGGRCLLIGPDPEVRSSPTGAKIPWVRDHHRSEAEDNLGLHPKMRHYFDEPGYFGSFRNRGRHYGRPLPSVFGQSFGNKASTSVQSVSSTKRGCSQASN